MDTGNSPLDCLDLQYSNDASNKYRGSQREGETENGSRTATQRSQIGQATCLEVFEEIKNYIEERSGEDPLVKGIPEDRNPFKEKGGCIVA